MSMDYSRCLRVTLTDTDIVVANDCDKPVGIKRIEVKYYITGLSMEPDTTSTREAKRLRRTVTERIAANARINPGESWSYYFGATSNVISVRLEVEVEDKHVIVEPEITRSVEEGRD